MTHGIMGMTEAALYDALRLSQRRQAHAVGDAILREIERRDDAEDDGEDFGDFETDAFMEGQRCALEGMDLPDGAYFAMAEEMGLDPY